MMTHLERVDRAPRRWNIRLSRGGLSRERRYAAKVIVASLQRSQASTPGRTVILCYHSIHPTLTFASATPQEFDEQVRWMKQHCSVVSLIEALEDAGGSGWNGRPRVALTFDDGYVDNFVHAMPVLLEHGVTATFFVTTGFVDRDVEAVARMRSIRRTDVTAVTWDQVSEMRRAGMDIGSHTVTHANLVEVTEEIARSELRDSRLVLEDRLGEAISAIAYPFGVPGRNVDRRAIALAGECGYAIGASILYRDVRHHDQRMNVPRIAVKNNSLRLLRWKIIGKLDVVGRWQERRAGDGMSF
jgi:peptidoglycan/xylan/chitin deacetylase (PgdA/CDA1 family)